LTTRCTHQTPSCPIRSLSEVSIISREGQFSVKWTTMVLHSLHFNGDGKSDILWRNTNGTVAIWEMNGGQVLASVGGQVVGNAWTIVGTGDFKAAASPTAPPSK
jgi:hypothetical protein